MPEHNYHLAFAKVMICGGRYTEKHTRCRTSTQMMIFTADTQKGGKMDDLISRQVAIEAFDGIKVYEQCGR